MARNIVVIGGGPAAVSAAIAAKKTDMAANVTLLTDEACEPYEKPPLSKGVLLGNAKPEDALIAGPGGLAKHDVTVKFNSRCVEIDRTARQVATAACALSYDALVIATGSVVRELPLLPTTMPHVHYLRNETQARAIKADLAECKRLLVMGAGLIGLEVAASAAELGIEVTVIESAPRIMSRACDKDSSAIIQAEHERHGVVFALSTSVTQVPKRSDGRIELRSSRGERFVADSVLVGVGVKPDEELALAAGLNVRDGIIVDAQCRTSDSNIFAAGDVTCFSTSHGMVRLENWRHAQDHGVVAGRNAAGASENYHTVPSYWSEQYGRYIQGIGWLYGLLNGEIGDRPARWKAGQRKRSRSSSAICSLYKLFG